MERPEKISVRVAKEILKDIALRQLSSGTILPSESKMVAQYGVSRGSVRESLRILETKGLIQLKTGPKGGPVVADVTSQEFGKTATFFFHLGGATIGQLLEARREIEPIMARLAARNRDEQVTALIRKIVQDSNQVGAHEHLEWMHLSGAFHKIIAGSSGNTILDLVGQSLTDIYHARVAALNLPHGVRERSRCEHEEIATAVLQHDEDAAERLMREHMDQICSHLERKHPKILSEHVPIL